MAGSKSKKEKAAARAKRLLLVSCRCRKQRSALQAVAQRPVSSFTAMLFECGESALFEPWQLDVSRLGG